MLDCSKRCGCLKLGFKALWASGVGSKAVTHCNLGPEGRHSSRLCHVKKKLKKEGGAAARGFPVSRSLYVPVRACPIFVRRWACTYLPTI